MVGDHGGADRAAASLAARLAPRSVVPARAAPLEPRAVRELVALLGDDPVVPMLARLARERSGGDPVASGALVELPIAAFRALYLHFGALSRVVAVPDVGAIAVIDGREVFRARHDTVVLHRGASARVRDSSCRECLAWTELAVLWSIRAVRDAAAGAVAAGLGLAAARHCLVAVVR